ncbi:hypothetical protein HanIR_Chr03g0140311 [Helianthus annuus]|nr:hypothetical protein HanIR_Chr03g0140311 [Helianthus annuus]
MYVLPSFLTLNISYFCPFGVCCVKGWPKKGLHHHPSISNFLSFSPRSVSESVAIFTLKSHSL